MARCVRRYYGDGLLIVLVFGSLLFDLLVESKNLLVDICIYVCKCVCMYMNATMKSKLSMEQLPTPHTSFFVEDADGIALLQSQQQFEPPPSRRLRDSLTSGGRESVDI